MRLLVALLLVAAAAGCTQPSEGRPNTQHVGLAVPETEKYPGIHVEGGLDGDGKDFDSSAFAANQGDRTYRVEQGCTTPWSQVLLQKGADGNGTEVAAHEPTAQCLAFSLRDFRPGDVLQRSFTWNGTLWDETSGYHAAPPGAYTWSIRFIVYAPDGNSLKRFDLDFPIQVE